jgi:hypothetical protein
MDDLLSQARKLAEESEPSVRATALLRIARVQTALDRNEAVETLKMGLAETRRLPDRKREYLGHARLVTAAVAPSLLSEFPPGFDYRGMHGPGRLVSIMLEHKLVDAAFDYVMDYSGTSGFPFGYSVKLILRMEDAGRRVAVLRRAIEAWRTARQDMFRRDFIQLFGSQWRLLPTEEAREVVREIVREEMERQDELTSGGYGDGTHISSSRQHTFFEIVHVLRHLDPSLVESLIAGHEQFAAAVRRFPNGKETMQEEAEERRKALPPSSGCCFIMAGSGLDVPYARALMAASKDGDFEPAIEHAMERFREDTGPDSPNPRPKEFWPSTCAFRTILYRAGRRVGRGAADYLDRIPDNDLRLFAQIELAAALAGLPEWGETRMTHRPPPGGLRGDADRVAMSQGFVLRGVAMRSPNGASIRCPRCKWLPSSEERWVCKCGHRWNTFWTRGLCPACRYRWTETTCQKCGESSTHSEWYVPE